MRRVLVIVLGLFLMSLPAFSQELTLSFATTTISGAKYSPKHIMAVWVVNSDGVYQRTLMVYARERKAYLIKWKNSSGGDNTDAVTGATLTSDQTHTVTWDLKNISGVTLPEGNYKLCMEITSIDGQGPYREIDFTVGNSDYTLTPNDGSNFTNISIGFKSGSSTTSATSLGEADNLMKLYPNPSTGVVTAQLYLEKDSKTTVEIYNIDQKVVSMATYQLKGGANTVDLSAETALLPAGIYFVLAKTDHYTIGKKLVVKK